jgi:CDP-glucose 4,6-dehydratase
VATARAGNVIGGGDTAVDRLLPDVRRAIAAGEPLLLRYPAAVRPWQHVLEPVAGYLLLAQRLITDPASCPPALNFGPGAEACRSVAAVAELAFAAAEAGTWEPDPVPQPPEHHILTLDSSLAAATLGWHPRLTIDEAVGWTVDWWSAQRDGLDTRDTSLEQIRGYVARAGS